MKVRIKQLLILLIISVLLVSCQKEEKEMPLSCIFSIECSTILDNMDILPEEKKELVPIDGVILAESTVKFAEGESVFDILQRVCKEEKILIESSFTAGTGSGYVEGIANIYEFDCGSLSGWQYSVNDEFVGAGCSEYEVQEGDVIAWRYTCDMGEDLE